MVLTRQRGFGGRLLAKKGAGNAEALTEGIVRVISNAEFANSLGKNARNSFEKSFTTEKMLENAWVVYEDVLKEKGLIVK